MRLLFFCPACRHEVLLPFFIAFFPLFSMAQEDSLRQAPARNPLVIEFDLENGGILKQKELRDMTYKDAYYQGANLRIGWKQNSKRYAYNALYNNPIYGVGIYSGTFNNDIIGNPFAVYGFVQVPFSPESDRRWSFDYRIALGLTGNFKPYDKVDNPLNLAIGSRNNVFIDFGLRAQYSLHPKWKAGIGVSFHHFSNGAMALPNRGINLVPLSLSVSYQPHPAAMIRHDAPIAPFPKKWLYHINLGTGVKQLSPDSDDSYLKATLGIYASRHVSHKWRLGAGVDFYYSGSGNDSKVAGRKAGAFGSQFSGGPTVYIVHILDERLVLNGNIGYYLHRQEFNGEVNPFFLRAGARYYVYKNLNAGASIKAHMGKADFVEWTVGYTINR